MADIDNNKNNNKNGILLFHQGWTDLFNSLSLINYYCNIFEKIYLIVRSDSKELISFYTRNISNLEIIYLRLNVINSNNLIEYLTNTEYKNIFDKPYTLLFHGYNDYYRNDLYKNIYKETPKNFVKNLYVKYDIPYITRIKMFNVERDINLEEDTYQKFIEKHGTSYILYHEIIENINSDFNGASIVNLNGLSNTFFDYIKVLENAKEIHLLDSSWAIFIYLLDAKYGLFNDKKIYLNALRRYASLFTSPIRLDNWIINSADLYKIYDETVDKSLELPIHSVIDYIKKNKDNQIYKFLNNGTEKIEINKDIALKTEFICHRINTIDELQNIDKNFGVEVDLRDDSSSGEIIMSHDPFMKGIFFEEYLKNYNNRTLILNIKSERIEPKCIQLLEKYNVKNYFFLDSSFPMIYLLHNKYKNGNIACRFSEHEPIENLEAIKDMVSYVWVDCFTKFPLTLDIYNKIKSFNKKICIVSPELQKQKEKIAEYREIMIKQQMIPNSICCKEYNIIEWL